MTNTNIAKMEAENTPISFQDHNGNLEIIPSTDDYFILTPTQVKNFIEICKKWLGNIQGEEEGEINFVEPPKTSLRNDIPFDVLDDGSRIVFLQWESVTNRGYKLEVDSNNKPCYDGKLFRGVVWFPSDKV
jgi:hypothetical protein